MYGRHCLRGTLGRLYPGLAMWRRTLHGCLTDANNDTLSYKEKIKNETLPWPPLKLFNIISLLHSSVPLHASIPVTRVAICTMSFEPESSPVRLHPIAHLP